MNRFQWITADQCSKPDFDRPVFSNENFVVLPTLGALVPGWLLVVPKREVPNLSFLSSQEIVSLQSVIHSLLPKLKLFAENVFQFEHGGLSNSLLSCGVEQAHLHLVPLDFDLVSVAQSKAAVTWRSMKRPLDFSDVSASDEYLMVGRCGGSSVLGNLRTPTSQWFRKIIAAEIGRPDEWDYKKFPSLEIMDKTISHFGAGHA